MNTNLLAVSELLTNFNLIQGENVVLTAPKNADELYNRHNNCKPVGYLRSLTLQIAGDLGFLGGKPVLYIKLKSPEKAQYTTNTIADAICPLCSWADSRATISTVHLGLNVGCENYEMQLLIDKAFNRLRKKMRVVVWDPDKEEQAPGDGPSVLNYLRSLIKKAGDISAVIVENLHEIASAKPTEVCTSCGHIHEIADTRLRPDYALRVSLLLQQLSMTARTNNVLCLSSIPGMDFHADFAKRTSLGKHQIPEWERRGLSEYVSRIYGVTANPIHMYSDLGKPVVDKFQKLIEYKVDTKEVTTTDIYVDLAYRRRFVCQPPEKKLDKEVKA